jgi:hypothetical protein
VRVIIHVEGIVSEVGGARELGGGMMSLELTLSPWRRHDSRDNEQGSAIVSIEMDLDLADAWLRDLDPGDCVRVEYSSLSAADANGNVHVQGYGEALQPCPDAWSGASN